MPKLKKLSSAMRCCVTALMMLVIFMIAAGQGNAQNKKAGEPDVDIHVKTKDYEFEYIYPAVAGRIPELKAFLEKDADKEKAEIAQMAHEFRSENKGDASGVELYRDASWQVVTDLPNWISLSGGGEEYAGGAHPNHWPKALLWDKVQKREVKVTDLFVSKAAFLKAIQGPFCKALNRQRAEKREAPIDANSTDQFDVCIDPTKQVVILGSADHAHFTRIGILMGPYAAGPYVEGDYEVTLPVTQAVLAAVRPEYRDAFAIGR